MSRKSEAKKRKAERLRNKKLIDRYPWIWPVDWHWKWIQVKEKYGTLRLYSNAAPREVSDLGSKYDHISGYFCIECGRMNVPVLTGGWVEPLCEDCFNKRIARQGKLFG